MSQYLILIHEDESGYIDGGEEARTQSMKDHMAFAEAVGSKIVSGNALQPQSTATTIRGYGTDAFVMTDGPFAETKEALGGYYLIEAADLDEALSVAKLCPARFGAVEVRPIMTFE